MTKYIVRDEHGVSIAKIGEYQYQQIPTLKPSEVIIDCNNATMQQCYIQGSRYLPRSFYSIIVNNSK